MGVYFRTLKDGSTKSYIASSNDEADNMFANDDSQSGEPSDTTASMPQEQSNPVTTNQKMNAFLQYKAQQKLALTGHQPTPEDVQSWQQTFAGFPYASSNAAENNGKQSMASTIGAVVRDAGSGVMRTAFAIPAIMGGTDPYQAMGATSNNADVGGFRALATDPSLPYALGAGSLASGVVSPIAQGLTRYAAVNNAIPNVVGGLASAGATQATTDNPNYSAKANYFLGAALPVAGAALGAASNYLTKAPLVASDVVAFTKQSLLTPKKVAGFVDKVNDDAANIAEQKAGTNVSGYSESYGDLAKQKDAIAGSTLYVKNQLAENSTPQGIFNVLQDENVHPDMKQALRSRTMQKLMALQDKDHESWSPIIAELKGEKPNTATPIQNFQNWTKANIPVAGGLIGSAEKVVPKAMNLLQATSSSPASIQGTNNVLQSMYQAGYAPQPDTSKFTPLLEK